MLESLIQGSVELVEEDYSGTQGGGVSEGSVSRGGDGTWVPLLQPHACRHSLAGIFRQNRNESFHNG